MPSSDLHYLTIESLAGLIERREVSPVEVTESVLRRIQSLDVKLGAFITVTADLAMSAARQAEQEIQRGEYRGPLHGVPISLKDLYDTAGVRTTSGSLIRSSYVPSEDATCVARLREAGAIVVGKNNLHEFAFGPTGLNPHYATTRNPWDLERIPGGSSGGSAVAVAAGLSYASLGSDTGGSIRIPAALCGTVGVKPTYGRISRHGAFPLSGSLDHVGPLTRSVRDAAYLTDAMAGHDLHDPSSSEQPAPDLGRSLRGEVRLLRAAVLRECLEGVEPELRDLFDQAVSTLRALGLTIDEVSVPEASHAAGASTAIMFAEAAAIHQRWLAERPAEYGPDVRGRLELGALLPAVHYLKGQQARSAIIAAFDLVWERFDVLLLPTCPIVAPRIEQAQENAVRTGLVANTRLFNLLGGPVCSLPCGFTAAGLPASLSVAARAFDEASALEVGLAYEAATPWHDRRPPID